MKRLYWYVGLKLSAGILIATVGVFLLTLFLETVRFIYVNDLAGLLANILQRMPLFLYGSTPHGCIIGGVIAMHLLAKNEELTIMRCLGIGGWRLIGLVSVPSGLLGILMFVWMEMVAVPVYTFYQNNEKAAVATQRDVWFNDGDRFIFIKSIALRPDQQKVVATDVTQFVIKDTTIEGLARAAQVDYAKGQRAESAPDDFRLPLAPSALFAIGLPSRAQQIQELWQLTQLKDLGSLSIDLKRWDYWRRISWPLLLMTLTLLMTMLVLYSPPRRDLFKQIVLAVALGILIDILFTLSSFAGMILQVPMTLAALAPLGLCSGLSIYAIIQRS